MGIKQFLLVSEGIVELKDFRIWLSIGLTPLQWVVSCIQKMHECTVFCFMFLANQGLILEILATASV